MKNMNFRVVTSDKELIRELLKDRVSPQSNKLEIITDCEIIPLQKYQPSYGMVDTPEILEFSVNFISGIAIGLFSNWLYDLIKHRKVQAIEVNGKEIEKVSKEDIQQIITYEININHDDSTKST
jgi:hypothetical protein